MQIITKEGHTCAGSRSKYSWEYAGGLFFDSTTIILAFYRPHADLPSFSKSSDLCKYKLSYPSGTVGRVVLMMEGSSKQYLQITSITFPKGIESRVEIFENREHKK